MKKQIKKFLFYFSPLGLKIMYVLLSTLHQLYVLNITCTVNVIDKYTCKSV